jgi:hypothetical protein
MIFRHAGEERVTKRKPSAAFFVSLGVHVVVAVALMRMLILNIDLSTTAKRLSVPAERVGYVTLGPAGTRAETPGRSGGDGRPVVSREIRVVAPTATPRGIPDPTPGVTQPATEGGTGPLVGTGGPTRGVRPSYSDPRLWAPPEKVVAPPPTVAETIDALIAEAIQPYNDSVARAAAKRDPTDWTVEKGGYKWGIDKRAIRLGPVSIPTALLAMLPLNLQGNPTEINRERTYALLNRDIMWQARQAINEADFAKAVRSIRERKERERAAALAGADNSAKEQERATPR